MRKRFKRRIRLIFLDLDGVLNGGYFDQDAKSSSITPACVRAFNRVLRKTGAVVVLISSWRYMIAGKAITRRGFGYLLRTHGVLEQIDIVGITPPDEKVKGRGAQIQYWLDRNKLYDIESYVVIDDMDEEMSGAFPFVQTFKPFGLTEDDADRVIEVLTGEVL